MGKIFSWLCILALAYYLYSNGVLMAVVNGNIPETGKPAEVAAPKGGDAYLALQKEDTSIPIDATIGMSKAARRSSIKDLKLALMQRRLIVIPDKTKLKVLANGKISVYSCMYRIVKVKVMEGNYAGHDGWMLRDDVSDNPLQEIISRYVRGGKEHMKEEIQESDPYQRD